LHERYGRFLWTLSRSWTEILDHCHEAVRLVPDAPSVARAKVLATLGQQLMLAARNAEAIAVCTEAIEVAQAVGDLVIEGHARNSLGTAFGGVGRMDECLAELHRAREIAVMTQTWADVTRAAVNEGGALQTMARHEECVAISLEGAAIARVHGLDRFCGLFLRLNAAESLRLLGRSDEAEEQLREVESAEPLGIDAWRLAEQECLLAVERGEFDTARRQAAKMKETVGPEGSPRDNLAVELTQVAIAGWSGDEEGALDIALEAMRVPADGLSLCSDVGIEVILEGLAAGASAAQHTRADEDASILRRVDELGGLLDQWIESDRWDGGRPGALDALRAHMAADVARAHGGDDPAQWLAVADMWTSYAMRPREAYARLRAAEAFARDNDRDAAAQSARDGYAIASAVGWVGIRDAIASLAQRARLDLGVEDDVTTAPADRYGLTPRELDVVALVAEGRTNRQIADALFISAKTASVHVSNILAKLGVSNRGEAAAAARRLGLTGAPAPEMTGT